MRLPCWLYRPPPHVEQIGAMIYLHGGPEGQARPGYSEIFPLLLDEGIAVFAPNVRGSGGSGREFCHADDREKRFAAIDDVADCARHLAESGIAEPDRIACAGWSYGGYLTMAVLTFHPALFVAGISICGMSDLGTFYRNTEPWIAAAAYPEYGHPVADRELLEATVAAAAGPVTDRALARGARRHRHQRPGQRVRADRRGPAGTAPSGALPAVLRRRAPDHPTGEPCRAGEHGRGLGEGGVAGPMFRELSDG